MTDWKHQGSRHARGYGSRWVKLRERILKRDRYLCQCPDCEGGRKRVRVASEVDHIVPKSQGGTDAESNLRAVATDCHRKLTVLQTGKTPKVRIGIDGWPLLGE